MSRMEDGLLSLKWNNHKSTFFHILSSLRKKETYTDATLACEGKFFPVHKLVMSTCSDYFSEIFERTNCKSPVVILKDIRYHDLESLLDYMYLGEVDVKQSELASLIKAAECLRIKGLAVPDEDPSLSHKKSSSSFESRASPSSKRSRTESSGAASDSQHYVPHSNKVRRSVSPTRSHSSSACGINTPVPSQSVNSDPLSQVPGAGLSMPPPSFSETKHLPGGSTTSDHQTSSTSSSTSSAHDGSNLVPVEMIKVEVEDDGNSSGGGGSNGSQLRRHHQDGGLPPPDQGGGRNERSCEDGGGEGSESEKSSLTNSYGAGYSSHPGEIEKEEHDQIDTFNGSDQMAGPSGVQGGSQMLNWGEEEGNFPHNLFGGEDSSHQQVWAKPVDDDYSSDVIFSHFDGPNTLTCLKCGRAYIHKTSLRRHMLSHEEKKPFQCPYCGYKAIQRSDVTRHIRVHTGEKPYPCPHCIYRATQSGDLDRHIQSVHYELCISCSLCAYKAPSPANLKSHERKKHTSNCPAPSLGEEYANAPELRDQGFDYLLN